MKDDDGTPLVFIKPDSIQISPEHDYVDYSEGYGDLDGDELVSAKRKQHASELEEAQIEDFGLDSTYKVKVAMTMLLLDLDPTLLSVYEGDANLVEDYYFSIEKDILYSGSYDGVCFMREKIHLGICAILEMINNDAPFNFDGDIEYLLRSILGWPPKVFISDGGIAPIPERYLCFNAYKHCICSEAIDRLMMFEHSKTLDDFSFDTLKKVFPNHADYARQLVVETLASHGYILNSLRSEETPFKNKDAEGNFTPYSVTRKVVELLLENESNNLSDKDRNNLINHILGLPFCV